MPVSIINKDAAKLWNSWLPAIACMGFIFLASSFPGSGIPSLFLFQDIAFHLVIYALLGWSFARALKKSLPNISAAKALWLTLAFGLIYGISDEVHQIFVPYRCASFLDLLIDGIGCISGGLCYQWLR